MRPTRKPAETQPEFKLTLRPEGEGPPAILRLRRLLKCALRVFGLRCVSVTEIPAEQAKGGKAPADAKKGE